MASRVSNQRASKAARFVAREGFAADDCVIISDREHDIRAARANGTRALAVSRGYASRAELEAAGPDAIVATAEALPAALLALPGAVRGIRAPPQVDVRR